MHVDFIVKLGEPCIFQWVFRMNSKMTMFPICVHWNNIFFSLFFYCVELVFLKSCWMLICFSCNRVPFVVSVETTMATQTTTLCWEVKRWWSNLWSLETVGRSPPAVQMLLKLKVPAQITPTDNPGLRNSAASSPAKFSRPAILK